MTGILLSVLFPGLGQFYYGKDFRGIVMLALGVTPLYPLALLWSVWDAVMLSKSGLAPRASHKQIFGVLAIGFAAMIIAGLIIGVTLTFLIAAYDEKWGKTASTLQEARDIVCAMERYRFEVGRYPEHLGDLVEFRPLRTQWLTDAWGRPYIFELSEGGDSYLLVSKGKDAVRGTTDALVFKIGP